MAGLLTELTGRTVRRVVASDEDFTAVMTSRGVPEEAADMLVGMFRASRRGEFAVTDPTLEDLLDHPATPLRATLDALVTPR